MPEPVPAPPPHRPPDPGPGPVAPARPTTADDLPPHHAATAFADLFGAVYLQFHRRDGKRAGLSGASRAVLQHLALAGPLTVGEAARHLDRAQSVVSDIVTHLEGKGLLEREPDPADRRRTLVWLTPQGRDLLVRDREVLSTALLTRAMTTLPPAVRTALLDNVRALLAARPGEPASTATPAPEVDPDVAELPQALNHSSDPEAVPGA